MIVFTVEQCWEWEGCCLIAVFSTRENAQKWILAQRHSSGRFQIEEVQVDVRLNDEDLKHVDETQE